MNHLVSIGSFAKLCETTTDTLNYYAKLGLLCPSIITATKRRLYDIGQYHTFHMIRGLSECGIPLADIRSALCPDSRDTIMRLIKEKEAGLRRQLIYLEQTYSYLEKIRPSLLLSQYPANVPFILTQHMPITLLPTFLDYFPISTSAYFSHLNYHKNQCLHFNIYPYPIGFILQKKSLYAQNNRRILLYSLYPGGTITNKTPIQDAGEYAAIIHKGSLESINDSITQLYDFIKKQHFMVASDTYINFYHNNLPECPESFYFIKVRFLRH